MRWTEPFLGMVCSGLEAGKYKNTLDCAMQIAKHEGMGTFLNGLVPRLGRVVPGQGIIFMSYTQIEKALTEWFA
jgi:solute carrier family 25 citrate transporter 1